MCQGEWERIGNFRKHLNPKGAEDHGRKSVECGLLEGVFRRHLLETGEASERVLYPRDLAAADEVFLCNSVRGLLRAEYVKPEFFR